MKTDLQRSISQQLSTDPRLRLITNVFRGSAPVYLVGGAVRSLIMGQPVKDLDICSGLAAVEVAQLLSRQNIRTIPTGIKHGTLTVLVTGSSQASDKDIAEGAIEFTSFRSEPGLPVCKTIGEQSRLEQDLRLRDFTINAIAIDIESGLLSDPCSGLNDIRLRMLRCCGSPDARFQDDPLRIMRMARLACVLGFSIDPQTFDAAKGACPLLALVSWERIRDEFSKILCAEDPVKGIRILQETGALKVVLPEVEAFVGFKQNRFHCADLYEHTLEVVRKTPKDLVLRWAALLHDVGKPNTLSVDELGDRHFYRHESIGADMASDILTRLKYSSQVVKQVELLVRTHMRPISCGKAGIRRLLRDTAGLYTSWRILKEADSSSCKLEATQLARELEEFDAAVTDVQSEPSVSPLSSLAIRGDDLMEMGIPHGPMIGTVLRHLHELVLDDPLLNQREILLTEAGRFATSTSNSSPSLPTTTT